MHHSRRPLSLGLSLLFVAGCSGTTADFPDKPLYAGLRQLDYDKGSMLIANRLRAKFPVGSDERALVAYVKSQEMTLIEPGWAEIRRDGFVCGNRVRATWTTDGAHRISTINALYSDTGCP